MSSKPVMYVHRDLDMRPEAIFTQTTWVNQKAMDAILTPELREEAAAVMLFLQTYFPEHFPSNEPVIHIDMLALMLSDHPLKAIAFPRGHAKSSVITFGLVLYRIVFKMRKFIVIVSDSEDKAKDFVMRIRSELEHNKKLIAHFSKDGLFKSTDWAKTDFITLTGIRITAKGAGQSMRGMLHLDSRPDMIVLDDIETNLTAGTDEIINFILTDVIPSTNRRGVYDICYVGTIIRDMAALHRMLINDMWSCAKYECVDENGDMIAPMLLPREQYEMQKDMYQDLGKMSLFYAENHNNPMVADDEKTFQESYFQESKEPEGCNYYIAYDPALPPSGRTKLKRVDRTAIIVLATDSNKNWYVVRAIANRDTPADNRRLLLNLMIKYDPKVSWIETIAAQRSMYLEIKAYLKKENAKYALREIPSHSGSKEARIEQLQPFYESGRIYHVDRKDKGIVDLERELSLFGRTPHDDLSDGLSFFINKVKYPSITKVIEQKRVKDDYFDYGSQKANWKIL